MSTYQYGANNPIRFIDVNGDSIWVSAGGQDYYYGYNKDYGYGFYDKSGALYTGNDKFLTSVNSALAELSLGDAGKTLVDDLAGSSKDLKVLQSSGGNSEFQDSNYPQYDSYIRWNTGSTSPFGGKSFIGLGHEMAHTQDRFNNTLDMNTWFTAIDQNGAPKPVYNAEKYATHIENQIRSENHFPLRTHYAWDAGLKQGSGPRIIDSKNGTSLFYTQNYSIQVSFFGVPSTINYKAPFKY